ncbi:hypothetical protein [Roseateles sp. PN1]|uniref:hypothetical protein n=1 Tax=Roseateles sp. PN1 TaxID=3137372 RepID=UPI003139CB41
MSQTHLLICEVAPAPDGTCPPAAQRFVPLTEALDFPSLGITAESVLYVWSWGFGAVLTFWFFGYCIGLAVRLVRKI